MAQPEYTTGGQVRQPHLIRLLKRHPTALLGRLGPGLISGASDSGAVYFLVEAWVACSLAASSACWVA